MKFQHFCKKSFPSTQKSQPDPKAQLACAIINIRAAASGLCRLRVVRFLDVLFLLQLSAHHKVGRNEEEAGKEPRHRVCDAGCKVAPQRHEPEAYHCAGHHFGHTGEHGKAGEAQPLNGVAVDDEHRQRDIENAVPEDKALGVGHDRGLARIEEQADEQLIGHAQDEEGRNAPAAR